MGIYACGKLPKTFSASAAEVNPHATSIKPIHLPSYPGQRYHYLASLIPEDYCRTNLVDSVWFELAPGEDPESIQYPDEELIAAIKPDVLKTLQACGFFTALDELLCPDRAGRECSGDFRHSKQVLEKCGIAQPDWSDVFHVLMDEGAFCDCEVLYNVAPESRLRAEYWRSSHNEKQQQQPPTGL